MQQCGLCSALSEVFRRLMCIGGSRRGSGESYYQELETEEPRRGGISVDRSDDGIFVRMIDPGVPPPRTRRLSQTDWLLLETLDTRRQRPLHTGRFLTMHKRRRKRLTTRSLSAEVALLDDVHHGQVKCVLDRVNQWPFNAFTLDNVTGGRSLPVLCVHLFHWYGLLDHFHLDVVTCWKLFSLIEEGYHSSNPYHNSIHATDVTQAMHCFLQEDKIRKHLTPLEIMAALIAAVTHDLDHPGVNQPFLIATSNHLAALYENTSVLENHHWRSAIGCLLESHVAEQIEDCRPELQRQICSLILATDITRQQEFLVKFKRLLDQDIVNMEKAEDRHFILQIALKCADISNPCRPWDVSKKWSQKVCEEFFRQGDYERQLKLPVTALCDRQTTSVPKIQAGFFKFVVAPLFEEWHRFLEDELSEELMRNLRANKAQWEALCLQEAAEETKTEISEAELLDDELLSVSTSPVPELSDPSSMTRCLSSEKQYLAIPDAGGRVGRRHSVPLSVPSAPVVPRTIIRRESLPLSEHRRARLLSAGCLDEGEEELLKLGHSSLSLLSSSSNQDERPVSAENLLPEPSIASITTVTEASRLSNVFHSSPSPPRSVLTRQQTFPPLQPYVRQRHMSTCSEVLRESNRSLKFDKREKKSPEPPGSKVAKLDESASGRWGEKENVAPGAEAELLLLTRGFSLRKPSMQTLVQRRRGSAPVVGLALREDQSGGPSTVRGCRDRTCRRGSVPLDIALQSYCVETDAENNLCLSENFPMTSESSATEDVTRNGGGKVRSRNSKKVLRRRSSGGPEMFCGIENFNGNGNDPVRWRRNTAESERRRGSLPIDVLLATHSQHSGVELPGMPGSTPSRTRPCAGRPVTPMSERQQLRMVRQMETGDSSGGTPPTPDGPRRPRRNGRGETPLHRAAIKGDAEAVQKLLDEGADPNAPDFAGWTPLHEACNHGWLDVAEALLDAGADVNVRGLDDDTPLHDAVGNAHLELARLLLERGADVQALNRRGKTPCDLAPNGMLPYLLHPQCIENLAFEKRLSLGGNDSSANKMMRRTRVEKSPRVTLKLHHIKRKTGKLTFEDLTTCTNGQTKLSLSMDEKGMKEDVYEFKSSSKEATPVRGNSTSPDVDKSNVESKSEKQCELEGETGSGKRPADNETDDVDDDGKRKKKKEETGKDGKPLTPTGRLAAVRSANNANSAHTKAHSHTPSKSVALATRAAVNSDRKSPSSPKGSSAPVSSPTGSTSKTDCESEGDGEKFGPKVPPLKIVIPQSGQEPETGGQRNGKNNSARHTALPYVVSSNSNDGEKDGSVSPTDPAIGMLSAEDQKTAQHQRVLRSSHRAGEPPSRPGSTGSSAAGAAGSPPAVSTLPVATNSAGPSSNENSPPSKQEGNPPNLTSEGSPGTLAASPPADQTMTNAASTASIKGSNPPTPSSGGGEDKTSEQVESAPTPTPAPVDLHPRKRKLKHRSEPKEEKCVVLGTGTDGSDAASTAGELHPHDQPVNITNCYQLYLDIRKQVERRRQSLFPVQPKPPQGFKDYLLNRGTYLLASNASSRHMPSSPVPASLPFGLQELFAEQERERHRLRLQHVIEKEKLVLAVEQEILRVHGRAARALANQSVPFSVCSVLRDKEVYNLITPEQEEKDRNARSRYNGRLFLGWLQDVDDKWEKIKENMLLRHHNEAESLHAVQKMDWKWRMVELELCESKTRPDFPDSHVPIVHVSDDFDLLPA